MCNKATQITFFLMKISALSETFWTTTCSTSSKKPSWIPYSHTQK